MLRTHLDHIDHLGALIAILDARTEVEIAPTNAFKTGGANSEELQSPTELLTHWISRPLARAQMAPRMIWARLTGRGQLSGWPNLGSATTSVIRDASKGWHRDVPVTDTESQ
jgi:hypothetical protein